MTSTPVASIADVISAACRAEPALFKITPLSRMSGSNVFRPCTTAAAVRDTCEMSTTKITGASTRLATWAVEAKPYGAGGDEAPRARRGVGAVDMSFG